MYQKFCVLISALLLASCAASIPYHTDYPLTTNVVHSRDGILSGNIPQGWFSSTLDTLGAALTILLMNDDVSATLSIRELKLDRLTSEQVNRRGLTLLAHLSQSFHLESAAGTVTEPQEFELRGKKFCSNEITDGSMRKRVVVFSANGRFYECEAQTVRNNWTGDQYARMFTAQQTFLSSLTYYQASP